MKRILINTGLLYLLSVSPSFSTETETDKRFQIFLSDNITLTGGPNDLGPTGEIRASYTDPDMHYKINIGWELYVNGDPKDHTTSRTNPDNLRIDALRVSYIQGDIHFKYGAGIEILGDLGGKSFQNNIHDLVGDSYIPADYLSGYRVTPTLNAEYQSTFWDQYIDIYTALKFPILTHKGIIDLQMMASHTEKDIYHSGINAGIGLNIDCKKYPDIPEFSGYPIRDFKVCTPESILTLGYGGFQFFWEIPLVNGNIQNSIMGLSYRF